MGALRLDTWYEKTNALKATDQINGAECRSRTPQGVLSGNLQIAGQGTSVTRCRAKERCSYSIAIPVDDSDLTGGRDRGHEGKRAAEAVVMIRHVLRREQRLGMAPVCGFTGSKA